MTPLEQREHDADVQRKEQRAIFVASLRDAAHRPFGWSFVLAELADASDEDASIRGVVEEHIRAFALTYGWPDTLRAIAQAMEADDQARREAMDRR